MAGTAHRPVATRAWDRARRDRGVGLLTAAVMGALVVLVYAAAVGIQLLYGETGPPGLLLSVVVTAVVALAFEPVRTRTRRWLQRLTHTDGRSRAQVLAGFSESVAGRYPISDLPQRIAAVVGEGTGARRTEVRLVVHDRMELAASWPDDVEPSPDGGDRHILEVRDAGELLGELTMITDPGHRLTPTERRLVEGLAAQSGLMLRVAGLRVELQRHLADLQRRSADLRRARRDLVVRQDRARQRLERDIHDGAQQEVIALLVNLRLVQTLLVRAPDRAMGLLAPQGEAIASTVRTLQDLAQGLYPEELLDDGPVAALRTAARHSPLPVIMTSDSVPRLPGDIEATVYFCSLEAMQNAAKHASARQVLIDVRTTSTSTLRIEIHDDGAGFDVDQVAAGRGLANIRDRVESVHGTLRLSSGPDAGTRLEIEIPFPSVTGQG